MKPQLTKSPSEKSGKQYPAVELINTFANELSANELFDNLLSFN